MKLFRQTIFPGALLLMFAATLSCEESFDNNTDADDHQIPLTVADTSVKSPGRGQYRLKMLSGEPIEVTANLADIQPVGSLVITKTRNGAIDETFGTGGKLSVSGSSLGDKYVFAYTTTTEDIDQLVGFTFEAQTASGRTLASDLTLIVTLSPRDNIPAKRWAWTSKVWVDGGNVPDMKDCEKDNFTLFNSDGSMSVNYGENTGSAGCDFDGFDVYHSWHLSDDEKWFVVVRSGLFDPTVVTDSFRVVTLTTEKIEMEIDYDLTVFGLGPEETYRFGYTAMPK